MNSHEFVGMFVSCAVQKWFCLIILGFITFDLMLVIVTRLRLKRLTAAVQYFNYPCFFLLIFATMSPASAMFEREQRKEIIVVVKVFFSFTYSILYQSYARIASDTRVSLHCAVGFSRLDGVCHIVKTS